ncbi:MAG: hydrogenase maturation protease [Anaerolineales bacterium]|nr:hydrogenase maturation protease [Anaerolineales bacterium]
MTQLTIIALGQELRGDDAAGLELLRRWQLAYPDTAGRPELQLEFAGLPGLGLLDLLAQAEAAILLDAVQSGAAPGTLHRVTAEQLAAFQAGAGSAHGWGAAETLALGAQLGQPQPVELVILGLEAAGMELGRGLSPAIAAALPQAVEALQVEVLRLLKQE